MPTGTLKACAAAAKGPAPAVTVPPTPHTWVADCKDGYFAWSATNSACYCCTVGNTVEVDNPKWSIYAVGTPPTVHTAANLCKLPVPVETRTEAACKAAPAVKDSYLCAQGYFTYSATSKDCYCCSVVYNWDATAVAAATSYDPGAGTCTALDSSFALTDGYMSCGGTTCTITKMSDCEAICKADIACAAFDLWTAVTFIARCQFWTNPAPAALAGACIV